MKYLLSTTALVLALALTTPAKAADVTVTRRNGRLGPTPTQTCRMPVADPRLIHWGAPAGPAMDQSGYRVHRRGDLHGTIVLRGGRGFDFGTFTHINHPIFAAVDHCGNASRLTSLSRSDFFGSSTATLRNRCSSSLTTRRPTAGPGSCCNDIVKAIANTWLFVRSLFS